MVPNRSHCSNYCSSTKLPFTCNKMLLPAFSSLALYLLLSKMQSERSWIIQSHRGLSRKLITVSGQRRSWPSPRKLEGFVSAVITVTINQVLSVDQYPLPKPEDLFLTLAGGTVFTKLDLSQAYLQLQLDEKSIPYVTVNTHQGLYSQLPFSVASAPAMFQKLMDVVLQGIPGVICYIDDILVCGKDEESHLRTLNEVLERLEKHGFRLKQEKCEFLMDSVEYLFWGEEVSSVSLWQEIHRHYRSYTSDCYFGS